MKTRKNNKLRKFLTFLLCLTLVLGTAPAAFAEDLQETELEITDGTADPQEPAEETGEGSEETTVTPDAETPDGEQPDGDTPDTETPDDETQETETEQPAAESGTEEPAVPGTEEETESPDAEVTDEPEQPSETEEEGPQKEEPAVEEEKPPKQETEAETTDSDDKKESEKEEKTPVKKAKAAAGDYEVTGADGTWEFDADKGVLYINKGSVTVKNASGTSTTAQPIIVRGNAEVTLAGVNIRSGMGPAITIQSPYKAELILADGTENTCIGGNGVNINHVSGGWAGIEVEFEYEDGKQPANKMASLIISGKGSLTATGNTNAAGIGGSNSLNGSKGRGLYGNITINDGNITATSPENGAGIGSSDNPGAGTSTGSYKKTGYNTWGTITINGGTVNAVSKNSGAGIGGGNHVDSGKIVINGGKVTADGAAGIGCGIGSSKNTNDAGTGNKGPGYYQADVEINGGNITATSNDIGAAIGGGMYCDARVKITGGTIEATGGSRQGNTHHGGAGIGGGYLGHAEITISGNPAIHAVGGDGAAGIGSGGSPNSKESRGVNGRGDLSNLPETLDGFFTPITQTEVAISGGNITAVGGEKGGAGVGLGVGGDKVSVTISGGTVRAEGGKSTEAEKRGGAGIGSGYYGLGSGSEKYFVEADADVTITGGEIIAIGGWGASGIGSGAENKMAGYIEIDAEASDLQAYADGTKFAVDTRIVSEPDPQGHTTTTSQAEEEPDTRVVNGNLLQGTFVHAGHIGDYDQNPEGLSTILITNDDTGEQKNLTLMPEGYRSYAADVPAPGVYTVYTDDPDIGQGEGRYFSVCTMDEYDKAIVSEDTNLVQYTVREDALSDNFYLFPVKTIRVEKVVKAEESLKEGLDMTLHFALRPHSEEGKEEDYLKKDSGEYWVVDIAVSGGVPQNKGYFVNMPDRTYDVDEVVFTEEGTLKRLEVGTVFGEAVLKRIDTIHGEGTDNNATIDDMIWNDQVTVTNTFEKKTEPAKLTIKKALPEFYRGGSTSNATVVFYVKALALEDGDFVTAYETWKALSFTEADEDDITLELPLIEDLVQIEIQEIYSAGYTPEPEVVRDNGAETSVTEDMVILMMTEETQFDEPFEVSFTNRFAEIPVFTEGIINTYRDGGYVSPADEEQQEEEK